MKQSLPTLFALMFAGMATAALAADNQLTDQEKKDGWMLLFNGKDYNGWQCNNGKQVASDVVDGLHAALQVGRVHRDPRKNSSATSSSSATSRCPNAATRASSFASRIRRTRSIRASRFKFPRGEGTSCHDFGAIYDLVPLKKNATKGPGVWNSVEIKCQGPIVSVKLNGELVCEMDADEFDEPGERAIDGDHKYKLDGEKRAVKDFARKGYLGFQDHGHPVWYKNVKLLPLN